MGELSSYNTYFVENQRFIMTNLPLFPEKNLEQQSYGFHSFLKDPL